MITGVLLLAGLAEHRPLEQYGAPLRVLAGGLLFGVTAAWNKGCFVGTSIQLMAGDLRGLISVAGWILGFRLLGSPMALPALPSSDGRALITLVVLVLPLLLLLWRNQMQSSDRPNAQRVDWRSSIHCGVMLGVVDNDLWKWDPSAVARALSHPMALTEAWAQGQGHVVFGLMLLVGMFADALIQRRWRWVAPDWRDLPRLGYGVAMALGAMTVNCCGICPTAQRQTPLRTDGIDQRCHLESNDQALDGKASDLRSRPDDLSPIDCMGRKCGHQRVHHLATRRWTNRTECLPRGGIDRGSGHPASLLGLTTMKKPAQRPAWLQSELLTSPRPVAQRQNSISW